MMKNPFVLNQGSLIYKNAKRFLGHIYNTLSDNKPKVLILVYHRVLNSPDFNPLNNIIALRIFLKQLDKLAKRYPIISLTDMFKQRNAVQTKKKVQVVLTFDDGYRDNYEVVFPILRKKGLPAAFFLSIGYLETGFLFWDWQLLNSLRKDKWIKSIEIEGRVVPKKPFESRLAFAFRVLKKMKSLAPKTRQEIIDSLKVKTDASDGYLKDRCISWQEAKEMSDNGMEIGSHGISHRSLTEMSFHEAADEIKKSKEIIERNIKKPCVHFSFPYGSKQDFNQPLVDYVKEAGYQTCLLNMHGYNHLKKDSFCFRRIIIEEATNVSSLLG